ncbi:GGDEF domain-containing protein [Clostridium lundense]|uniref:GGDEF domain-containing protein n=1 Tax=Clostridium lundense TaxID=319475 RepID=UPI0004882C4A|nr:GGDEF domain-containing protein [Clostridium lundense]
MLGYITETIPSNIVIDTLKENGSFFNGDINSFNNILDFLIEGFALHKIIFNEDKKPCDIILINANKSFEDITSIKKDEILGKSLREFFTNHLDVLDIWINIFSEVALEGKVISFKTYCPKLNIQFKVNAFSPKYGEFAVFFSKHIEHKKTKILIPSIDNPIKFNWKFMAYHDPLTTLPNRRFLIEKLNEELTLAKKCNYIFAIMFIDIDNFKIINDSLGHEVGDFVLKEFSTRLKNNIRQNDTVFRLGGDEFVIFLKIQNGLDDVTSIAERILKSLRVPFKCGSKELLLTSSIGISVYPKDGNNIDTLIKHADKAMYDAKKQCGSYFKFFNSSLYNELSIS